MRHAHIVVDFHARRVFFGSPLQKDQRFPGPTLPQQPEPLGALLAYAGSVPWRYSRLFAAIAGRQQPDN